MGIAMPPYSSGGGRGAGICAGVGIWAGIGICDAPGFRESRWRFLLAVRGGGISADWRGREAGSPPLSWAKTAATGTVPSAQIAATLKLACLRPNMQWAPVIPFSSLCPASFISAERSPVSLTQ
jgi:hypothetical protein